MGKRILSRKILAFLAFLGWFMAGTPVKAAGTTEKTDKTQVGPPTFSEAGVLTLEKALAAAEDYSPAIRVARAHEVKMKGAENLVGALDYPDLFISAVESKGLPGYFSPTPLAFDGLLNSPYRVGAGADLLLRWNLVDFSRWDELAQDRHKVRSSEENTKIERLKLDQEALELYLLASLYRGQREVWKDIEDKSEDVLKVAKDFVRTGQYNEDKMLNIRVEKDQATMEKEAFDEKYRQTLSRLALLTGLDEKGMECPLPSELEEDSLKTLREGAVSPYVTFADSEIEAAKSALSKYSSERLPKVFVMGSAGLLEDVQLVSQQDYTVWAGITMPIFDEFRIGAEEKEGRAEEKEREERLKDTQLMVGDLNRQYDEKVGVAQVELPLLAVQEKDALRAYRVARERFLSYKGTVTDMREALRDLSQVETKLNEAKINLLKGLGSKTLLNGGTVAR